MTLAVPRRQELPLRHLSIRVPWNDTRWSNKLGWYGEQGILPLIEGGGHNGTLIITEDDANGGINSTALQHLIKQVFAL